MKKKYLIISIIIIIILLIIAGILYYPKYTKQEFLDYIQNIEYDVKITRLTKVLFTDDTGAYDVNYKLVNLENRKLYSIYYGGFWGHDIDRYSIREKNLTHEQIEQISKLSDMESEDVDEIGSINQNEINLAQLLVNVANVFCLDIRLIRLGQELRKSAQVSLDLRTR